MKPICLAVLMSLFPLFSSAQSYDKLWRKAEAFENDGRPKSAYDVARQILKKAERDGNRGQALSARLKCAGLRQEWASDSFFTDVAELETLRERENAPEARAVYASILASIYEGNRLRTQARDLELTADDMREWTTEQYDSAATANWQQSLADIPALAKASSKEWLPFIGQGDNSSYYGHDLLHVLWMRYKAHRDDVWQEVSARKAAMAKSVMAEYERLGNRNAALLVAIDWTQLQEGESRSTLLHNLIDEYGDLPLCTEAYLALVNTIYDRKERIDLCRECIGRYPRYARINDVRNVLNTLLQPELRIEGDQYCYPGRTHYWKTTAYNTSHMRLQTYRLPEGFALATLSSMTDAEAIALVRRQAAIVETIDRDLPAAGMRERSRDTIEWTAYPPGAYVVVATAVTTESEASAKEHEVYKVFRCSRLQTISQDGYGRQRTIVVDAMSGHPVEGATVEYYYLDDNKKRHTIATLTTDAEGRVSLDRSLLQTDKHTYHYIYTRTTIGDDKWLSEESAYLSREVRTADTDEHTELRLYTDRAIYRPGQTVHVGGILFSQKHWEARTMADKEVKLTLLDANWKTVGEAVVQGDEMGAIEASFVLPAKGLPGTYHIRCSSPGQSLAFRVEEYKRPTFEVTMDDAPDVRWPADSIILTGRARGYNGVPVRQGRVTGTYRFTYPWWWHRRFSDSPSTAIDTVETDTDGAFSIRVPLSDIPKDALMSGIHLELSVDVLSVAGETRQGSTAVSLCTKPLRVSLTVPEQQDRDRLSPIEVSLLSSTGQPTDGTVRWTLYPASEGKRTSNDVVRTGKLATTDRQLTFPTESLADLPSGQYELFVEARAGTDSADAKACFLIFGLADKRLPKVTPNWLYCPDDNFGPGKPARIQVGTSLADVAFYYSIVAADSVMEEHLMRLDDEMRTLEIPYLDSYGDGATLQTAFVKDGRPHTGTQALRLDMPDRELRYEWTTFRDNLHSGQTETWTLRITRPDGTPAPAQLMATIYDASLDAIAPHYWHLFMQRAYNISSLTYHTRNLYTDNTYSLNALLPMRSYKAGRDLAFDSFGQRWLRGLAFQAAEESFMLLDAMSQPRVMMAAKMRNAPMAEMVMEEGSTVTAAAASTDADVANEAAGQPVGQAEASVRTNFAETAAFMPRLMADADGRVAITFTLPESLTTWQFMGVAHTADMMTATLRARATARKEMMARLFLPRFLRGGDDASLRATVQNLTDKAMNGTAVLEVFDPETERVIVRRKASFKAPANGEAVLAFPYTPAELPSVVAVRLTAKAGAFSDGEQHYLAILPSTTWVTESVEIRADSMGTFTTDLSRLFNGDSPTATNRRLTVEYTTHPVWYALQALPSLREPASDDVLSLAASLYGQALATHIAATTPRLRTLVDIWRKEQAAGQPSLDSRLSQDEELKQIVLDETPWLRDAEADADRKARLMELFDDNVQTTVLPSIAAKLRQRQNADGSFSWFPGMPGSEIMTRLVCIELTRLRNLTDGFSSLPSVLQADVNHILREAVAYAARSTAQRVSGLKKAEKEGHEISTASLFFLHYVYVTQYSGVSLTRSQRADVAYILDHLGPAMATMDNHERAMAAIVLHNAKRDNEARKYYASLLEHTNATADGCILFDTPGGSFVPTGNKLITHAAAMEAVRVMEPDNSSLNKGLNRWLLRQKRTQMWESAICTTDAIYALLRSNPAAVEATAADRITLSYAKRSEELTRADAYASIAGLGYIKKQFADGEAPRSVTVERRTDSEAWGAVYATYLTPVADASASATGFNVRCEFSNANPAVGERITIRYVITADRDYEYVCLSAQRPACAEPATVRSGYEYRGGLGYYRAVRDARTDYFFDSIPKGTYVLEETAFVDREGSYATGLTTLRCLYAPEFGATTTSLTIQSK